MFSAPGRPLLSYAGLLNQVETTVRALREFGVKQHDRIAVVMPNGPEMAAAFVSVASCATCAPLNPSYRTAEFDFYLSDLNAKALVVSSDIDSPARDVAGPAGRPGYRAGCHPQRPGPLSTRRCGIEHIRDGRR